MNSTWLLIGGAVALWLYKRNRTPVGLTPAAATGAAGATNLFNLLPSSFD